MSANVDVDVKVIFEFLDSHQVQFMLVHIYEHESHDSGMRDEEEDDDPPVRIVKTAIIHIPMPRNEEKEVRMVDHLIQGEVAAEQRRGLGAVASSSHGAAVVNPLDDSECEDMPMVGESDFDTLP